MPKFLKLPMDAPDEKRYIAEGVNAMGKKVYLAKYTRGVKAKEQVFAWLECTSSMAHLFKTEQIAKLAGKECTMPVYNAPAEDAIIVYDVPAVNNREWDFMVEQMISKYLEFIEVEES